MAFWNKFIHRRPKAPSLQRPIRWANFCNLQVTLASNCYVYSLNIPYHCARCIECNRKKHSSENPRNTTSLVAAPSIDIIKRKLGEPWKELFPNVLWFCPLIFLHPIVHSLTVNTRWCMASSADLYVNALLNSFENFPSGLITLLLPTRRFWKFTRSITVFY